MIEAPVLDDTTRAQLVTSRIDALREVLARRGATGIRLDTRHDFAWLTLGGQNHVLYSTDVGVAPIVMTADDVVILAPVNEFDRIVDEEVAGLPLRVTSVPWWGDQPAGSFLTARDVADELEQLRSVLVPVEHARLEWLAGVVLDAVGSVLTAVRPGTNEDGVVADVSSALATQGVRLPVVLVAADDRIARYRHPLSASRSISRRVMLVVVAERWGLHVAHTEFAELDARPSEVERRARGLGEVLAAMRAATIAGNTLGAVLDEAKRAYADSGMADEWLLHHQGGTIGYQARERVATPGDQTLIRPGMAFAWNPSAVGFKREETLFLDESGTQHVLTTTRD